MKRFLVGFVALIAFPALAQQPGPLARNQVEGQIRTNFSRMDANKDGVVTRAESNAGREAVLEARFVGAFNAMDTDKNGSISKAEFIAANRKAISAATGGKGLPDTEFGAADANRDGKVTLAEALAKPMREFDSADTNKDAVLSPAERQAYANKLKRGR
jgi:hypothetical protein